VDPVPDPFLRKSVSAGNRTRDPWICSQELWPLDHRDVRYSSFKRLKINVCLPNLRHCEKGIHIFPCQIKYHHYAQYTERRTVSSRTRDVQNNIVAYPGLQFKSCGNAITHPGSTNRINSLAFELRSMDKSSFQTRSER
jgi:hypothetical protein